MSKGYLKLVKDNAEKSKDTVTVKFLNGLQVMLDMYEGNKFIFKEGNFLSIVWAPLVRKILYINNNTIRLKEGESINKYTTQIKQLQYPEIKNIHGAKIDLRFVVDIGAKEIDVGAGEIAKECASDSKIHGDEGKLVKEGKDIAELMVNSTLTGKKEDVYGPIIQIAGLSGEISIVHLHSPGLYVGIPVSKLSIPKDILCLESFINTFQNIYSIVVKMEHLAVLLKKVDLYLKERKGSIGGTLNRPTITSDAGNNFFAWVRQSWYPPPRKTRKDSKLPEDTTITEEVDITIEATTSTNDNHLQYDGEVDQWDWVLLKNGSYYNVNINIISDTYPLRND